MKLNKYFKISLLLVAIIGLVCWDFAVSSQAYTEEGTYRYESEFDAISSATTNVAIVTSDYSELSKSVSRTTDPGFNHIQEMVDKAIALQGGFGYVINPGDTVMIKVNLVGGNSQSGEGENTDVRVVKALIKNIDEFTGGDVVIIVAEGTARSNDDPTKSGSVWENSGYTDLLTDSYLTGVKLSLLNLNQSYSDLVPVDLGDEATSAIQGTSTYYVHKAERDADVYITVPVLKIHDTGITNALKLQIGSAPGSYYGYNKTAGTKYCPDGIIHDAPPRRWTTEAIVDFCNVADIDFVLVDAIMCLEREKVDRGDNRVRFNTIVAGADPVAVDHVCAKLMGLNPDDIAHITLAEKVGLGTNQIDFISLSGVSIEDAKIVVEKNSKTEGKWGQSNRSWILSKTYDASSITDEVIENEATLIPSPGLNEWSETVYFFDDRIDLSSFYNNPKNKVTYAFSKFYSPQAKDAELWLGFEEGIVIYLNGEEIYKNASGQNYDISDIGSKKKTITLKKGTNTLLVKTINLFGDYSFALNICDKGTNGNRVEGLKFYNEFTPVVNSNKGIDAITDAFDVFPNPASVDVNMEIELQKDANVQIEIYDLSGKSIKTICNSSLSSGSHSYKWDLTGNNNQKVNAGSYVSRLSINGVAKTQKILVK